jgi:hypothetical protein
MTSRNTWASARRVQAMGHAPASTLRRCLVRLERRTVRVLESHIALDDGLEGAVELGLGTAP